jgi:hypothetical protein
MCSPNRSVRFCEQEGQRSNTYKASIVKR